MDYELPDEIATFRDVVRKFAVEQIRPHVREWDEKQETPPEFRAKLGELGILGILTPEEYGGSGLGYLANAVVMEELCRQDGSLGFTLAGHTGLCSTHLLVAASDEQKARYLPKLASGEWWGAWALTEPGSGSDASAMQTKAVKYGDGWRISGQKQFITNGSFAEVTVVFARTEPDSGTKGISAFVLEKGAEGFKPISKEDKLGMRPSDTAMLSFDNVYVAPEALVGECNRGFIDALRVLERGRVGIAASAVGVARGALEESLQYAKQRETFGKPIAQHQAIQFMLADMATDVEAARLLVHDAALMLDRGEDAQLEASIAKLFATEAAMRASLKAVQIHGGMGCTREMHVERYMRDAKVYEIGEGTSEVQRMLIARHLLSSGAA